MDFHNIIKIDSCSSVSKFPKQIKPRSLALSLARSSPALLSLPSVLNTLASGVGTILDTSSDALKAVADGLGAGSVVDGLANAAASCADEASGGLGDAA